MIQNCANLDYLLSLDFEYGSIVIDEILRQRDEKEISDIYWFGNSNGINTTHKTFDEFKKSIIPQKPVNGKIENLTVDEITEKTKRILELYK